jgi:DNA polymerase-1
MGFRSKTGRRVWCCQVAEFLLLRQGRSYPSLEQAVVGRGLGSKIDVVKLEYWDKGVNTHEIPRHILSEYALKDVELTYELWRRQQEEIKDHQRTLFSVCMQDIDVLAEMEWNGLYFNKELSLQKAKEIEQEIDTIQEKLSLHHSVPAFNWSSNDHLSALLYGGEIVQTVKVPDGVYKTGAKAGQLKFRNEEVTYHLPRKYKPIKGSELQKENKWSVGEEYLRRLKGDGELIQGILRIKELEKLKNTYFLGLPTLHDDMHWEPNVIHGQFNQCVARTGRLSSSKPNQQNISDAALEVFESRWTSNNLP